MRGVSCCGMRSFPPRRLSIVELILVSTPFVASTSSFADCVPPEVIIAFPFEGQTIPVNAELRVIGFRLDPVEMAFPDGATRTVAVVDDELGPRLDMPTPLAVGAYSFVRVDTESVSTFVVADVIDEEAPAPPIVAASQSSRFTPPDLLGLGDDCVDPGFVDVVSFFVEGVSAGDLVLVDGAVAVAVTEGSVGFARGEGRGGTVTYDVNVRDFAGNESDPTRVEVWSGCPGGCASTGSLPLFGALLAFARRATTRRRKRSA